MEETNEQIEPKPVQVEPKVEPIPFDPVAPKAEVKPKQKKSHPLLAITCILVLIIGVMSVLIYTDVQEISKNIENQTLEGNHSLSYTIGFSDGYYRGLFATNQTEIFNAGFNQCTDEINRAIDNGQLKVVEE